MFLSQIPGFNEELAATTRATTESRDFAFLNLPTRICDVEVNLMTLRHYIRLQQLQNPFICGGPILARDIAQILWILSPYYIEPFAFGLSPSLARARRALATRRRREIVGSFSGIEFSEAKEAIAAYVDLMLADAPTGGNSGTVPVTSPTAVIIEFIAEAYGWPQETIGADGLPVPRGGILDLPLPSIYQHIRRIILLKNPTAAIVDRKTDALKRKYLQHFLKGQK